MQRIDVIRALVPQVTSDDLFICGIGAIQNDWANSRPGEGYTTFTLGVLGSVTSTGLGLALALPHRRILVLDTDGSMLMNSGILCTLGNTRPPNLTVIVFDNGMYENIGGLPTFTSRKTDLAKMAEGAGCVNCLTVRDEETFSREARRLLTDGEMGYLVAKIERGEYHWPKEKRRSTDGVEEKYGFLRRVEKLEGIVIHGGAPQH